MTRLENGQAFPALQLPTVGGGTISLPDDLGGQVGVVPICRGAWCPHCNAQLAAFSRAKDALDEAGVRVVALSVDDEPTSTALAEKLRLTCPLAHSADADQVADQVGAYVNDEPRHLQSTGFVLAPDRSVVTAVCSSGAVGRPLPDDVIGLVDHATQHSWSAAPRRPPIAPFLPPRPRTAPSSNPTKGTSWT